MENTNEKTTLKNSEIIIKKKDRERNAMSLFLLFKNLLNTTDKIT